MHQSNRRFPILLWGDLVEGRRPVLRRALAGFRAHECMYAWVYLTEYLALRRLLDLSQDMPAGERRNVIQALDGDLWARLDRSAVDPHCQLSKSGFEAVAHMACLAAQSGEMHPVFVELGSTFFASKTKFEIVDQVARAWFAEWPRLQPRWVGIDNCLFMRDTACLLHGQAGVELVGDYRAVAKPDGFAVFWSRFVASYVFQSSIEFAGYLADRFQAIVVEDAYSTTAQDVPVFNHGQPEVFFSAPTVMGALEQADFEIHILDWYPDFPAGSAPCHVIRYLAAKKGLLTGRVKDYLAGLGFNQPGPPVLAATLLDQLNAAVTPRQWRAVKLAKRQSPVWGRTPSAEDSGPWNFLARMVKDVVKPYNVHRGWRRYRLEGPMAVREIHRALGEEKP